MGHSISARVCESPRDRNRPSEPEWKWPVVNMFGKCYNQYAVNTLAIPHVECKAHLCVSHNVTSVLSEYDRLASAARMRPVASTVLTDRTCTW